MQDICIYETTHFRTVIPRTHINQAVIVRNDTVSAVIAEDDFACTGAGDLLAIGIVCESVGNVAAGIGDGNGATSAIEVVSLECAANLFTDQTSAVDILGSGVVCGFGEQFTKSAVGIVGIGGILSRAKVADSHILGIVGVSMTVCGNQSVCRVVGARQSTVRQHIAVKVIGNTVAIEHNQAVVGVILKRVLRRIDSSIKIIIRLTDKH